MFRKRDLYKTYISLNCFISTKIKTKPIDNVYFATIQKAGSQYVKQVFSDSRIQKYTQLLTYPQHRYEWDEFHKRFPKGTFVPGLYMSYDLYEEIIKPNNYKTFYVMRDPRDIVVSWYYSMLKTHGIMGKVGKYRNELQKLSFDEGLHYCIDALSIKFMAMRTWKNNEEHDSNIYLCKFEQIKENTLESFKKIFDHCSVDIPENVLHSVLSDYTKEKLRQKDLAKREDKSESHYRKKSSNFREAFKKEHLEHFKKVNGNLAEFLGYEAR